MFLTLKISGGLGISYEGRVDFSTLPDELISQARTTLTDERLSEMAQRPRQESAVDTITYEIKLGESKERFRVDETQADTDLLDLIDKLRPYLILQPQQ